MAITTFSAFHDTLGDLAVSGVSKKFDNPPTALNTADMPAQWVELPTAEEPAMTYGTMGGWPTFRMDLVVAYKPVAQGTQVTNWDGALTICDAVLTALRAIAPNALGRGPLEWTIRVGVVEVGQATYWAVIAEVTGHG